MLLDRPCKDLTLAQQVETRVRESTHGRIRNLEVEENQGHVMVRGQVPSHHTKQLALQGALELLSGDRFSSNITVV
jgi:osmotically-inducible protein OsmY